jgi:hypothetical protein
MADITNVGTTTEHHAMKTYWGSGGIAPRILDLCIGQRSGQLHAPAASPSEKSSWYSMYRRLGGRQSRSGRSGEEKNSQSQPRLEPPIILLKLSLYFN